MFADLVGFTPFAEERDPEAVRESLARYFDVARERIERYGGTVEKFIGDAVMAVWGTPVAHEDDPERAVRAALELVDAVAALEPGPGGDDRLTARAAVLTGEAAVDPAAIGQGMVTGDLVNTASRLQALAPPGSVLVDEATRKAVEQAVIFETVGEQALKGKTAPLPAWQALRVVGGIGGARRTAKLEPPFAGRDDELRMLKDLYHATAREGRARLVSVGGIAGIGKSRLAWEFFKYIDGLVDTTYWQQGRSVAYGEGLAFWALGEMVRERARIAETDDAETSSAKLAAMLEDYVDDADERERIGPRVAALLGLADMPSGTAEETYLAWRTLFERVAERGPTVLLFEDLHWAEPGLLDFIETLVASPRHRPILVITLARPELLERRPDWGAGVRRLSSIDLGRLNDGAMELLLIGLVPGIPPEAIDAIRKRSEGVPLYAVETVRMLLDQRLLTEHEGRYRLTGDLGALAVPESLTGLLGARIDTLPVPEREVLGHAAVLGQTFATDRLVLLCGLSEDDAVAALDDLVRREIVELDDDPRSPTRGQHRFVQGLMREVAYGRLSRRERTQRHLAAAELFERLANDELAGVVASHYVDAYRAAPKSEQGEIAARAHGALLAAADRAAALGARDRAVGHLLDALSLTQDGPERLALEERILEAALDAGLASMVVDRAKALEDQYEARGDRDGLARASTWRGRGLIYDGRPDEGRQVLEDRLAHEGGAVDSPSMVPLASELARACLMSGDASAALPIIEDALPKADRYGLPLVMAELLPSKAFALFDLDRPQEAMAVAYGAVSYAQRVGAGRSERRARMMLSSVLAGEDPRAALEVCRIGMERSLAIGDTVSATFLFSNGAQLAVALGDWLWVDAISGELDLGIGNTNTGSLWAAGPLISLRMYRGDLAGAAADLEEHRTRIGERSDRQTISLAATMEFELEMLRGNADEAVGPAVESVAGAIGSQLAEHVLNVGRVGIWARDATVLLEMIATVRRLHPGRLDSARTDALEAAADAIAGDRLSAIERYDEAIATLKDLGVEFEVARSQLDRVIVMPDAPGTETAAAEARATFERLGARPFLERLDAAMAAGPPAVDEEPAVADASTEGVVSA